MGWSVPRRHVCKDLIDVIGSSDNGADAVNVMVEGKGLCVTALVLLRSWNPKIELFCRIAAVEERSDGLRAK